MDESRADAVRLFLYQVIGEDFSRGGLAETPYRVLKAWAECWASGYNQDPSTILKTFEDGAAGYDEMIIVSGLPVFSHCEHHIAPFWGEAHIGYIPDGKIVGLSKFGHLINIFARRLQVQERLTTQIANAIEEQLHPKGCGVILRCRHMCMESRGIQAAGTITITSSLQGLFRTDQSARGEFLKLQGYSKGII
jgi:GTP cyclohydrolase IA